MFSSEFWEIFKNTYYLEHLERLVLITWHISHIANSHGKYLQQISLANSNGKFAWQIATASSQKKNSYCKFLSVSVDTVTFYFYLYINTYCFNKKKFHILSFSFYVN